MNLQENILRIKEVMGILNEGKNFTNRRLSPKTLERNFNDALNYIAHPLKFREISSRKKMDLGRFTNLVIDAFMDNLHPLLSRGMEEEDFPYDSIYDFLKEFYSNRIKERYQEIMNLNENRQGIKEVMGLINENDVNRLKRRLKYVDELVESALRLKKHQTKSSFIEKEDEFIESVKNYVVEAMYYDHFEDLDDGGNEWGEVYDSIRYYIDEIHKDRLINIYKSKYLKT